MAINTFVPDRLVSLDWPQPEISFHGPLGQAGQQRALNCGRNFSC